MAETLHVPESGSREEIYSALLPQVEAVTGATDDLIANMANVAAILMQAFGFHWIGFYRTTGDKLILGPFQGPLACVEIPFSRGVCGQAARTGETVIVADVDKFPGHIACSALSKSEIVVPGVKNGKTLFVLDIDSDKADDFDATDKAWLEKIVGGLIAQSFP